MVKNIYIAIKFATKAKISSPGFEEKKLHNSTLRIKFSKICHKIEIVREIHFFWLKKQIFKDKKWMNCVDISKHSALRMCGLLYHGELLSRQPRRILRGHCLNYKLHYLFIFSSDYILAVKAFIKNNAYHFPVSSARTWPKRHHIS